MPVLADFFHGSNPVVVLVAEALYGGTASFLPISPVCLTPSPFVVFVALSVVLFIGYALPVIFAGFVSVLSRYCKAYMHASKEDDGGPTCHEAPNGGGGDHFGE